MSVVIVLDDPNEQPGESLQYMSDKDRAIGLIDVAQNCTKAYRLWKTDRVIDTVVAGLVLLAVAISVAYEYFNR